MKEFSTKARAMIECRAGYLAGLDYATGLKVGDEFLGVVPAAEIAFPKGSTQYDIFVTIALSKLPKRIVCENDVIISLEY